jgi:glycosyltransferase involved in cell wall biosynthesis
MNDSVRISVFIPVWNEAEWLPRAIESVLAQTYPYWELVIGDNASTDDLAAIAARFPDARVRYHRWAQHTSIFENFNRTVLLCRYEWVQLLCADDRILPHCLATLAGRIRAADERPTRLAMAIGAARRFDEHGRSADAAYYGYQGRAVITDGFYDALGWLSISTQTGVTPWNFGAVAISRDVLNEAGGFFRPEAGLCSDVEAAARLAAYGDVAYIDQPLMDYTVRGDSDRSARASRNRERGDSLSPMAVALMNALRGHEERREVLASERAQVHAAVARAQLQRALQHRYLPGGRGRRGAAEDLLSALIYSPRTALEPRLLLTALGAVALPRALVERLRTMLMARRYRAARPTASSRDHPDGVGNLVLDQAEAAAGTPAPRQRVADSQNARPRQHADLAQHAAQSGAQAAPGQLTPHGLEQDAGLLLGDERAHNGAQ